MRILVLGGTVFLGKSIVQASLERGHQVTLFNRGRSSPGAFPDAETLIGDRQGDLSALDGRDWDVVVDVCGYTPSAVRATAQMGLGPRYLFISSISAYAEMDEAGLKEDAPLAALDDPNDEEITGASYGPLKAACEKVVEDVYGTEAVIIRPGLIVGPDDPTDRFTYWPRRVSEGGRVMAPEPRDRQVQFIDTRDLAGLVMGLIDRGSGAYNAVGPIPNATMGDLIKACQDASDVEAEIVWMSEEHLLAHQVGPWMELPLWIPSNAPGKRGMLSLDATRAVEAGLVTRPILETVVDTLRWDRARGNPPLKAGLARDKEEALIAAWDGGVHEAAT